MFLIFRPSKKNTIFKLITKIWLYLNSLIIIKVYPQHNIGEGPCGKHYTLEIYCKYFNFTIQDAIKKKGKMNSKFAEGEIFYVASSLLKAYEALNTNNYC